MSVRRAVLAGFAAMMILTAQQTVSFSTQDHGRVCANLYGRGEHAVLLAHGGRFTKESWQAQAQVLAAKGYAVLAIDFRGFGCSNGPGEKEFDTAPFEKDVLAAFGYLKAHGAKTVSVVGGSFGGAAAGDASIQAAPGTVDRIVFLGAAPNLPAEELKSRTLFLIARNDANSAGPRLPRIQAQYEKAPPPKQPVVLPGSAHAQFLFQTDESERVMQEILRFLSLP
jgi:pimeloyl-ACP methyl ester carboxylesterase